MPSVAPTVTTISAIGSSACAEQGAVGVGQRLHQPRVAGAARVLVEIGGNRGLRCGLDKVRRRKIGEALPQVYGARLVRQRRKLGKDGGAKAAYALGHRIIGWILAVECGWLCLPRRAVFPEIQKTNRRPIIAYTCVGERGKRNDGYR